MGELLNQRNIDFKIVYDIIFQYAAVGKCADERHSGTNTDK